MLTSSKEAGSAAVEFILSAIPLTLIFISVVSVSASSYVLGIIRDTAVEGARFAALADQSSNTGCKKTQALIHQVLVADLNPVITCNLVQVDSVNFEKVKIQIALPFQNAPLGLEVLEAEGWAPRENQ